MLAERYLHFENIDMQQPSIFAWCSRCQREFTGVPKPGERVDDVLLRMRTDFNAHYCGLRPVPVPAHGT